MTSKPPSHSLFLLMGSHLFAPPYLPIDPSTPIVMIEDYGLCTHFRYHKHKLILFLESMRNHADLLKQKGYKVHYYPLTKETEKTPFKKKLEETIKTIKPSEILSFEIEDRFFREELNQLFTTLNIDWSVYSSPMFLHSIDEFKEKLGHKKRPFMRTFYEGERKEREILMEGSLPIGGKFSFDQDNRLKLPKDVAVPSLPTVQASPHHEAVCQLVDDLFPHHPGSTGTFWLPTTRPQALAWLRSFFRERFAQFGPYEDAFSREHPFIFHSVLSPLLNNGLLTPQEVIEKALELEGIPIQSMEGFIRQVMGWREFIRGIDECFGERQESSNFFNHKRKLTDAWYEGTTGIVPLDEAIQKVQKYGYCHHIERLMVLSNCMLLAEIHPQEVYRWFMELFVDSADWVMGPNVYGMGQFADGGIFATKPYICGSNYIIKMSHYKKGEWSEVLDGLYWRFINNNRAFFGKQPRLAVMASTLDRFSDEKKRHLFGLADTFIDQYTN